MKTAATDVTTFWEQTQTWSNLTNEVFCMILPNAMPFNNYDYDIPLQSMV